MLHSVAMCLHKSQSLHQIPDHHSTKACGISFDLTCSLARVTNQDWSFQSCFSVWSVKLNCHILINSLVIFSFHCFCLKKKDKITLTLVWHNVTSHIIIHHLGFRMLSPTTTFCKRCVSQKCFFCICVSFPTNVLCSYEYAFIVWHQTLL